MDSPSPQRWPDETLPVEIRCTDDVRTRLETLTRDGMLAIPRVGLGVGGLLLGSKEGNRIDVLDVRQIACAHTMGPSFVLSDEELVEARAAADARVVGWYLSKTNAKAEVSDGDRKLFESLCPDAWQLMLLIRPSKGNLTQAAFGVRAEGKISFGAERELLPREEAPVVEEAGVVTLPVARPVIAAPVVVSSPVAPPVAALPAEKIAEKIMVAKVVEKAPEKVVEKVVEKAAPPERHIPPPAFATIVPKKKKKKKKMAPEPEPSFFGKFARIVSRIFSRPPDA